ncbi:MAG: PLP-dependent aminotransferase family protein [Deferribacteraceae bacterium]|jgi:2-aminoadipate transaminase|nr:PLP-dependent aminotransferase family protein [Deferribacteraceae bacterium]
MQYRFSKNILSTPKSFIREILKFTQTPDIISFAGGLPNKVYFPVDAVREAADKVLCEHGQEALQYTTTEGYDPLREFIVTRYKNRGIEITKDEILIVSGSQQALDLSGKVFLDTGNHVVIEKPGYLGAIQAFSIFSPHFHEVSLNTDGIDISELKEAIKKYNPKFFYATPNFQNPSGLTYSLENRKSAAEVLKDTETVIIEDDPYSEIRFLGEHLPPVKKFAHNNSILLGSFSKIVAPGLRIGWACAPKQIMEKLVIAKQAADLHTNYLAQRVLCQYLYDNDIDKHIARIRAGYLAQRTAMIEAMGEYFPEDITYTQPEGGMFLWVTMPEGFSAMELLDVAVKYHVVFVPGEPFYADGRKSNSMRLNYTCSDEKTIREGIKRLSNAIKEYAAKKR